MLRAAASFAVIAACGAIRQTPLERAKGSPPLGKTDAFMVYSAPKTATTSLQFSLGLMLDPPCDSVNMDGEKSKRAVKCHATDCARAFLSRRPTGSRTWIFTSMRSPFDRLPSAMFQGIYHEYGHQQLERTPISRLINQFHSEWVAKGSWLKQHYEPFGINVTAHPFDFQKGYVEFEAVWNDRLLNIILLRTDHSAKWEHMIQGILPPFKLVHKNDGNDKEYADTYKDFLAKLRYTDQEIAVLRQDDFLKYAYAEQEVDALISRLQSATTMRETEVVDDARLEEEDDISSPGC